MTLALSLVAVSSANAGEAVEDPPESSSFTFEDAVVMNDLLEVWTDAHPGQAPGDVPSEIGLIPTDTGFNLDGNEKLEAALIAELEASDLERTTTVVKGEIVTTYHIPDAFDISITKPAITPMVWGGKDSYGIYVTLSLFDQNLIVAGHGFVLAAAICAIPAVGTALCLVAGAIITAATVYISTYNVCKAPRSTLKIYPFNSKKSACVRP
ncbi:MAG: hypothetical protein L0G23_04645 [Ruaniaceae bacterium]|nr:hypothetical protein [Ruaniaceae bacterium]